MREIIRFCNRCRNRISKWVNIVRLRMYHVNFGRNCVIHGKIYIKLFKTASVSIGDNFYCSSGWNINALSTNRRGGFYATHNSSIVIGNNVGMSSPVFWSHLSITVGNNVKIGANSTLIDTDAHSLNYQLRRVPRTDWGEPKPIVIEDDVMLGMNCIILKGVTIGARSIVAAGSVVTKSFPADSLIGGNPARLIRKLD